MQYSGDVAYASSLPLLQRALPNCNDRLYELTKEQVLCMYRALQICPIFEQSLKSLMGVNF